MRVQMGLLLQNLSFTDTADYLTWILAQLLRKLLKTRSILIILNKRCATWFQRALSIMWDFYLGHMCMLQLVFLWHYSYCLTEIWEHWRGKNSTETPGGWHYSEREAFHLLQAVTRTDRTRWTMQNSLPESSCVAQNILGFQRQTSKQRKRNEM